MVKLGKPSVFKMGGALLLNVILISFASIGKQAILAMLITLEHVSLTNQY